jgi:hypothetical protein
MISAQSQSRPTRAWRRLGGLAAFVLGLATSHPAAAQGPAVIRVGSAGQVATIAEAATLAGDGDTVEVQAGDYVGDVAVWEQRRLTIRAVGGRARVIADGKAAEGKGLWVIRDGEFVVEGFDFVGARVEGGNGAGIRFERGRLTVRDSKFIDNQMGILTNNDAASELVVERCEFAGPRDGTHWYHNLYVGLIDKVTVIGSWSHNARGGHLLKSRARESHVLYNRLTDEGGTASYEAEFPNGGKVRLVGNLIEQGPTTQNRTLVAFGAEGYRWPVNELSMAHNTVVNRAPGRATMVRAAPGPASTTILNNLWVGGGTLDLPVATKEEGNLAVTIQAFRDAPRYDFRPAASGPIRPDAKRPAASLAPQSQYVHERSLARVARGPLYPGAFQR